MENWRDYAAYMRRVVQVTREHIRIYSQVDFKIGFQLGEKKIALTKTHNTYPRIEKWVTNSVITRPVLDFVYMDVGVKKVFKIQEAAKYSNDTLT